jgi:hypothetical protein
VIQPSSPFGQASSLLKRGDLPLPNGVVSPGTTPVVAVATAPAHPSNVVQVQMRRDGGFATVVRAVPEVALSHAQEGQQWYRTLLPTLDEERRVDYRVELVRAGQRLATLPADGSWLTVIGGPDTDSLSAERSPDHSSGAPPAPGVPRWAYDLTFFAALTINVRAEILGETPEGYRMNFFTESGRVVGPRIDAVLRPEGGDWVVIRRDGIAVLDFRGTYETVDGALILDRAGGFLDLGPDGYAKIASAQFTGWPPFYASATWSTNHPDWKWLNRCQGFEVGRVVLEELQVQCDIYIPEVGGQRSDA